MDTEIEERQPSNKKSRKCYNYTRQVVCALVLSCSLTLFSFIAGSTSMLPEFFRKDAASRNYTDDDLKWIASGCVLVGIPGNLISYSIGELIGPRLLLRWMQPFVVVCYLLMAYIPTYEIVVLTRLAIGILLGMCGGLVNSVIAEISSPKLRGFLSALPDIVVSGFLLCVYTAFAFLSVKTVILLCIIPIILGFLGSFIVPESPIWLVKNAMRDKARISISRMMGESPEAVESFLPPSTVIEPSFRVMIKTQILLLKEKCNWKPISQVAMVFVFKELGGHNSVLFYAAYIFRHADLTLDPLTCTILIGGIRLFTSIISSVFHDRIGRRPILTGSFLIAGISSFTAGLILSLKFLQFTWLPLIALMVYVAMNGFGIGPIPWILLGELVPSSVRLLGSNIIFTAYCFLQFTALTLTAVFVNKLSVAYSLMLFGLINGVGAMVIWMLLPETKQRFLMQIEKQCNESEETTNHAKSQKQTISNK